MKAGPTLEQIRDSIAELLRTEELTTLATIDTDGFPSAAAMHIAGDGLIAYIHTFQYNNKHASLQADPNVSYVVNDLPDDRYAGRRLTRSVQMQGHATLVTDADEIQHAVRLSFAQFPWLADTSMYNNINCPTRANRSFTASHRPKRCGPIIRSACCGAFSSNSAKTDARSPARRITTR
ncbi:pyridoxamine 5'-phosphate oxidase family protein [Nocardia sp. NPDC058633]|uniref:pyridoxamine 5'-phosphate oxidase family protein n=1 Tax=Nocardia sp. NPDC058633 TaxID=3346568 RepID=UPI00366218F3